MLVIMWLELNTTEGITLVTKEFSMKAKKKKKKLPHDLAILYLFWVLTQKTPSQQITEIAAHQCLLLPYSQWLSYGNNLDCCSNNRKTVQEKCVKFYIKKFFNQIEECS